MRAGGADDPHRRGRRVRADARGEAPAGDAELARAEQRRGAGARAARRARGAAPGVLDRLHNDRDRREFICAGAGAGMAAAFGAPVGGVLFVLEEAASHWSPQLVWRVFTACLVATFTLAFLKAQDRDGDISLAGLLSFGTVQSVEPPPPPSY